MATTTVNTTKDASAIGNVDNSAVTFDWNGKDPHHPVGVLNGAVYKGRSIIYFPISFTGINKITSAVMTIRATSYHNAFGSNSSKTLKVARHLRSWTENSGDGGENDWSNSSATYEAWSGVNSAGVDYATYAGGTDQYGVEITTTNGLDSNEVSKSVGVLSDGDTITVNITGIVRSWQSGSANNGVLLYNNNETAETHYMEFGSRELSGYTPSLTITYDTNTGPSATTINSPTGGARQDGRVVFNMTMVDADTTDYVTEYEIQVSPTSAFTTIAYSNTSTISTTSKTITVSVNGTLGLNTLTLYYWRARLKDSGGVWSPYSAGTDTFQINSAPSTPTGLSPTGGTVVSTQTPSFSGTSSDSDAGDYTKYVKVTIYNSSTNAVVWDSGDVLLTANGAFAVTSGVSLALGTSYYWRASTKDTFGLTSSTSSSASFSTFAGGASLTTPNDDTGTGWVKTLTPVLTFTTPASITNYTIKIYDTSGAPYRTIGPTSATGTTVSYTYAGTPALNWNNRYFWTAQYTASGVASAESSQAMFHVNSSPVAVQISPTDGQAVGTVDPSFELQFSDADLSAGLADSPTKLEVEVTRVTDGEKMYDLAKTTGLTTGTNTMNKANSTVTAGPGGATLTKEILYRYRARYTDNSGTALSNLGAYSSYRTFKPTDGPVNTVVVVNSTDLTSGAINKPNPTVQYTYTGFNSKAQIQSRVIIRNSSTNAVIYDSGFLVNAAASATTATMSIPAGYLVNTTSVIFDIISRDSDSVDSAIASSPTYTTAWTVPGGVDGVSATVENGSVVIRWDESTNALFAKYRVYRREYGLTGAWSTLGDVSVKETNFYTDYTSAVNKSYEYRVTQFVDYGASTLVESSFDEAITSVSNPSGDNWFIVPQGRSDLAIELYAQGEDRQAPFQEEIFEPFGRERKVVVRTARYGTEGSFEAFIPSDEVADKMSKINEIIDLMTPVYLKDPFGAVLNVYIGAPSLSYQPTGHLVANISYIEVR
jgi:hypothetical protein